MATLWQKISSRPWLASGSLLLLAVIGWALFGRSGDSAPEAVTAMRGRITEEVSLTGKTKPAREANLAFEKGGKVSRVLVKIGDQVAPGQTLVQLDANELSAQLRQAQANILREQARLDQLLGGARSEDIEIKRTELEKANQDLQNDIASMIDVLQDAYAKADDAIRKQIDDLFINDDQLNPQLSFTTTNSQNQLDAESGRAKAGQSLQFWKVSLDRLSENQGQNTILAAAVDAKAHLAQMRNLLTVLMDTTQNAVSISAATQNTYKTYITSARTSVNAAITAITNQEQLIASQKLVIQRVENELSLKLAGSAPEEIQAQRAQVRQAEASAAAISAQLSKATLTSSIRGTISKLDVQPGEIVSPNLNIVSVISESDMEIEANLPEADLSRVQIGSSARVTLDAYGEDVIFEAAVGAIDPAETVIEGVSTYKMRLQFTEPDARIKSGMTANIDIVTAVRENAIFVPQRSVGRKEGKRYVMVYVKDQPAQERAVEIGIRSADGNIEITSGLNEGEVVLRSAE